MSKRLASVALIAAMAASTLTNPASAAEPDWHPYDALLARHVTTVKRNGVTFNGVDYAALAADAALPQVIASVENFPLEDLDGEAERLAFYINAYNIFALRLVAAAFPIDSIKDLGSLFRSVWKHTAGTLGGRDMSLDEIEHGILRKLGEPRIHLSIVCASISCPDLRREAYRGATLDAQLEDQARNFLANADKGLAIDGEEVRVSRIFDWFEDDFDDVGGVDAFIMRYHALPDGSEVEADINYDWRLNSITAP